MKKRVQHPSSYEEYLLLSEKDKLRLMKQNRAEAMNEAYPPTAGSELWTVFHSEGDEAGLTSRKFATEAEARAKCDEWNETYPGHIVIPPNAIEHTTTRNEG